MPDPVTVSLTDLQEGTVPLSTLEEAFGPSSLGILIVKDLPPHFPTLRERVLSYSSYLANLPCSELSTLERPDAKYLVGWSHGKEKLRSGHPDANKGSYYINCSFYQNPTVQNAPQVEIDGDTFPEYTEPNVWPAEQSLPGFQKECGELCRLIIDTAGSVAQACDRFGVERVQDYKDGYLEEIVKSSLTTKARLLHYFPSGGGNHGATNGDHAGESTDQDDWCAVHADHGCLTGLTSAMYIDESKHKPEKPQSQELPPSLPELLSTPDPSAGLYILDRQNQVTQVKLPRDCLAFQTGEALERITKGKFKAVPHFVRGISQDHECCEGVARNTLAVFTQPNLWEVIDEVAEVDFATFSREVVNRY